MELTYEDMIDFMERYFNAYSAIAQDPKTTHLMRQFLSPDFKVTQYFPRYAVVPLDLFLEISSSHPHFDEKLIPKDLIVDERQKKVAVYLRGEFTMKSTGEHLIQMFSAHYSLALNNEGEIKIQDLLLFTEYVPPGKTNIVEQSAFHKLE
jgi:hypothetical protein